MTLIKGFQCTKTHLGKKPHYFWHVQRKEWVYVFELFKGVRVLHDEFSHSSLKHLNTLSNPLLGGSK